MVLLNQQPQSESKLTTVRKGQVVKEMSQEDVRKEELKKAEERGDKVAVENLSEGVRPEKAPYRERLYMVQDIYTKRIAVKEKELAMARTTEEQQKILREVKEMGAFCRALEEEIRWLRGH